MEENDFPEETNPAFQGFRKPKKKHFFSLPNEWTDITADIDNLPELKIVEYVIRHTWGFQNYDNFQDITINEFMSGRKHRDGSRMDRGTGLRETGAKRGIARALEHGYIVCDIDASDLGRIIKSYKVKMLPIDEPEGLSETPDSLSETLEDFKETARGSHENPRTDKETHKDMPKRQLEKKDTPSPLSPEALLIFNWCVEDGEYDPKLETKVIGYCEEIAKDVKTREQYNSRRDVARSMIHGEDKTVYLGNIASKRTLNAWKKVDQQTLEGQENDYIEGVGMPADTYNLAARLCRKYQIKLDPGEYIAKELERIYRLVKSKSRFEHLLRDAGEKSVVIEDFLKQLEDGISVKL